MSILDNKNPAQIKMCGIFAVPAISWQQVGDIIIHGIETMETHVLCEALSIRSENIKTRFDRKEERTLKK